MNQEVFGLRYDFIYRYGHYMELTKSEGLTMNDLSALQLRMLEANQVHHLLPLEIKEVDFRVSLLYNLSAKRMLSHVLKVEGLTILQFTKLLYAIVCTVDEGKNYMLYETGYVLKDNFIFLGHDWSDVYLTYVPLDCCQNENSVLVSLEALVNYLALKVKEDDRNRASSWLQSLFQSQSLLDYKGALLAQLNDRELIKEQSLEIVSQLNKQEVEPTIPKEVQSTLPKAVWGNKIKNNSFQVTESVEAVTDPPDISDCIDENQFRSLTFVPIKQRSINIALAVTFLLSAFVWQNYFTYPSTATLRITCGLTLLFIDSWFVIRFLGLPTWQTKKRALHPILIPSKIEREITEGEPSEPSNHSLNIQEHYKNLHMHTTLLSREKPNATIFLGNRNRPQPLGARLERKLGDTTQLIVLEHDPFTIGRGDAETEVDYRLEEAGVSRLHAEIVKNDDGYGIKDVGSMNGTLLNGESMVAYQSYPLKDGDEITIVRIALIFRL
ncbi:DUF6382 domain-containing protein [Paenibacillus sp. N3.4]|uniref:DUF6382 domain-containing protein n=1 Tax=Paenibacillus sp. N3.4 TaxID=2603222 RepID=UPI0011C7FDB2|nr:DUF6382 domain-containing protein [Paenibacillus sp. N3.4]TXK85412.1 FHA domain-containing protein [Paenibacillus sp. N3.4]